MVISLSKNTDVTNGELAIGEILIFIGQGSIEKGPYVVVEPKSNGSQLAILVETGESRQIYPGAVMPFTYTGRIGFYFPKDGRQKVSAGQVVEIAALGRKYAEEQDSIQKQNAEEYRIRHEKAIALFNSICPTDAKAVIVAELQVDHSNSQEDYFHVSPGKTLILGFSHHDRDNFAEFRKFAANAPETEDLVKCGKDCEHREKYTGGRGYYLAQKSTSGWAIRKMRIYNRERFCLDKVYEAENLRLPKVSKPVEEVAVGSGSSPKLNNFPADVHVVDYSERCMAIFGNTFAIKDRLNNDGWTFNKFLTHPVSKTKMPGWVISKKKL